MSGQTEFIDKNGKTIYAYPVVLLEDQSAVSVEGESSVTEFVDPESQRRIYATPLVIMEDRRTNKAQAAIDALLEGGKLKSSLLPSYVDDVLESASYVTLPAVGEEGKIYVTKDNGYSYRWSGSSYIQIGQPLQKSSAAQVDAGTDDAAFMTVARVEQAINKRAADVKVNTVADLRLLSNASITRINLIGYTSAYDGGEGAFSVKSGDTTTADNGGTVIVDALGRRWFRQEQLRITPQMFGAIPDEVSGGTFDNKPALDAAFAWALDQQTGVVVDLQGYTWSCSSAPVIGKPSTAATPNQAQPITVRGASAQRMAGRKGAKIKVMATSIGQHESILRVDGTQAFPWLTFENFALECPVITANIAAQTPTNDAIVLTGADSKGFATGTPVLLSGGGGASEISRGASVPYYLIKAAGTDMFKLALSPENAAAGTAVTLTTAWTGTTVASAQSGSAVNGLLFDGTRMSSPRLYGVYVKYADNAFVIRASADTANGEFAHFHRCEGILCKRFFYMPSTGATGQALETTFIECGGNPRYADGEACFEFGGGMRGYGVTAFSFNCSVVPVPNIANDGGYRKRITFVKDNGSSGSNTFIGGRVENITTLFDGADSSWEMHTTIEGMTFAGIASTDTNPFVLFSSTTIPAAGGTLSVRGCYIYSPSSVWARTNCVINFKSANNSTFLAHFKHNAFSFNRITMLAGATTSAIEFEDCTQKITNTSSGTVYTRRFSQRVAAPTQTPISERFGRNFINCYAGIPSNLLAYPNFGNTTGASVVAPAPWVHFGAASFNRCDMLTDMATPSARTIRIEPSSGVKQVITGVTPTAGTPFFYQANAAVTFMSTYSDRIRIAIENDTTGEVYDEVFLGSSNNKVNTPITLTAIPTATGTGQSYRIVIENKGTVNVNNLRVNWQLASSNANAAYITPRTDGSTEADHTTFWESTTDTLRAVGRMAIPYKTDTYGKSSSLRDIYSDVYLSQTTERLTYAAGAGQAAGQKWWEIPRVQFASAMPTTGTWTANDYVKNSAPSASPHVTKGWIRLTTGSNNVAGTDWVADTTGHAFILTAAASTRTLTSADNGKIIPISSANLTLTLPSDASIDSVEFPVTVASANVTFQAPAGVSVNGSALGGSANFSAPAIHSVLRLRRVSASAYVVAA